MAAVVPKLTIQEADGSPSGKPATLNVSNGTLADNGDGSFSLTTGSGGAPTDATYITQTANGSLSNEQALSALATGMLKNTTTTGVLSIGTAGTDYTSPSSTETMTNKTLTAPKFADGGFIADNNGNEQIIFHTTASAVNQVDITNAATGGAVIIEAAGGDSNIHLVARAKGNGLTKISVLQQLNTTDGYKHNSVILTGWGIHAQSAAANHSETVTFGITFAARPIVLCTYGGDSSAANTSYGSGGNNIKGPVCMKAHTIATTSFVAQCHTSDGTSWGATDNTFYQWLAIGEL